MTSDERRTSILNIINNSAIPVSGAKLSDALNVSRQIIVSDIALLRASGYDIISTHRGYILKTLQGVSSVIKVNHNDEETEEELNLIVDMGGTVIDVFVNHKVYGTIKVPLNIRSRRNVQDFMNGIKSGKSTPLKNITSGYHYHTISAESDEIITLIKDGLQKLGYLIE
jgi:hypothetical protein